MHSKVEFTFRFRGQESRNFLEKFPALIAMLMQLEYGNSSVVVYQRLARIFFQTIQLRKLVSYASRVESLSEDEQGRMTKAGKPLMASLLVSGHSHR